METMNRIREAHSRGELQIANIGPDNQPQAVDISVMQNKVQLNSRMAELGKQLLNLSWEERYEWVNIMKLKGNRLYSEKKYEKAIEVYLEALIGLDFSEKHRLAIVKEQLQYPLLANMSTCYYKLEQWDKGLAICQKILDERPRHIKALFKKGGILAKMGRVEQAKVCFEEVLKENPDADIRNCILQEQQQLRKQLEQQQTCYKRMFEQEESSEVKPLISHGSSKNIPDEPPVLEYREPNILIRMLDCLRQLVRRHRRSSVHND